MGRGTAAAGDREESDFALWTPPTSPYLSIFLVVSIPFPNRTNFSREADSFGGGVGAEGGQADRMAKGCF